MKKLTIFILITLILPTIFIFSGCQKSDTKNLIDYYNNYLSIANSSQYLKIENIPDRFNASTKIKKVGFVYSERLVEKINDSNYPQFNHLEYFYNTILDDAMGPFYLYAGNLYQANVSKKTKDNLYSNLKQLKNDYLNVCERLAILENTIDDATALDSLQKLYASYENIIKTATHLSGEISTIYFNEIMINPNPNYYEIPESQINLRDIALRTSNRLAYYKSIYVNIYFQTYIYNQNVSNEIILGIFNEKYEPYDTLSRISYSNTINSNLSSHKDKLIELAKTLYLIQCDFINEYENYLNASNKIIYCRVDEDSSYIEQGYKNIMDKFSNKNGIAYSSFYTVKSILDICY